MPASTDSTDPKGLRGRWASPPRSGLQRFISPWQYRNLRAWAGVHIAAAVLLASMSAVTLALGGTGWKAFGWAMVFLAGAAVHLAYARWELSIARSQAART